MNLDTSNFQNKTILKNWQITVIQLKNLLPEQFIKNDKLEAAYTKILCSGF